MADQRLDGEWVEVSMKFAVPPPQGGPHGPVMDAESFAAILACEGERQGFTVMSWGAAQIWRDDPA